LQERECQVLGQEISKYAYECVKRSGYNVYFGEIYDEKFLEKYANHFDIVTAIEVLEHLYEPKRCIQAIYTVLRKGGIFFYTTGNATGPI
jgi:2-polyprenyl-6-hydroxyphenyl methylase/3-demethylubiquinone-9 3-methyltransferase